MFPEGRALEFLLAAAVALIVVGPKDLPILMRKLGQFLAKLRGMAAEFRASFDELARQSELEELRREVEAMRRGHYEAAQQTATDAGHVEVSETFSDIRQDLSQVGAELRGQPAPTHGEASPQPAVVPEPQPAPVAAPKPARAKPARAKPARAKGASTGAPRRKAAKPAAAKDKAEPGA